MSILNTRNLVGLVIIAAGIIMLLGNLNLIEFTVGDLLSLWPVILLYFGLKQVYRRESAVEAIIGLGLILLGGLLLGRNIGVLEDIDLTMFWRVFWPIIIILIGFSFFSKHRVAGKSNFAILGGIDNTQGPWKLNSGSYLAFMGGIDLDLRMAEIKEEKTVLDFTAIMGGIDIIIPDDVDIECKGTGILGGVELIDQDAGGIFGSTSTIKKANKDNDIESEPGEPGTTPKKIIIQARAFMGGISIKTKSNPEK